MSEIKQINTGVAELLVVRVPEGAYHFAVMYGNILYFRLNEKETGYMHLPKKKWAPLRLDKHLSEEECIQLLPHLMVKGTKHYGYMTANADIHLFKTAKEAFASLMQANGVYIEKPKDCANHMCYGGKMEIGDNEWLSCSVCDEAEANTGPHLILVKK